MGINTAPEVHRMIICGNVFVRHEGKYLLLRRSVEKKYAPGYVHPVGGKIEIDEDPMVGALRELDEEAGIRVKNVKLEAVLTEIQPVKEREENWLIFHFSGEYESGDIGETEEGTLEWFTKEEILDEKLFPSVREVIEHILNDEAGCVFGTFAYGETEGKIEVRNLHVCSALF